MTLTEENVGDYAETLVLQVRDGGRVLDYSPESIAVVDDLFRVSDDLLRMPDFPESQRNLVIFYNGCYLGEVMARHLGGAWRFEPNWFDASLVFTRQEGGIQVHPFQKVFRRITEGPENNGLRAYYDGLQAKLAEHP